MKSSVPAISLVTVTYQSGEVIEPFLKCVDQQSIPDVHLIVVDNASRDTTLGVVRARVSGNVHLIENEENRGVATGNNQGIRKSLELGADWILLINNDTEFEPDLCARLLQVARERSCRVVVPAISYCDHPDTMWYSGGDFAWRYGTFQTRHSEKPLPGRPELRIVDYAPTCCMLVHRSVFFDVGLMDDAYFVYWDDTDFCWRLKKRGIPMYLYTGAVLAHKVSKLTGGARSLFTIRYASRNQVYFMRKHFPAPFVACCVAVIRMKDVVRRMLGKDTRQEGRVRSAAVTEGLRMPVSRGG